MAKAVKNLVRYKNPGQNSVYNPYSFVTEKKAKQIKNDYKESKAYRADLVASSNPVAPAPPTQGTPPAPPATAPIEMDSSFYARQPVNPGATPPVPGVTPPSSPGPDTSIPTWWISNAITNPSTPEDQFANAANALLPTLAPEDQRTLASYLAQNHKDVFGGYSNTNFGSAPTEITDAVRKQYLSPQRAQLAINLLDRMKTASGSTEMGGGYDFLKNAVNLINQFAVDGVMTREKYGQFTNAVSNLTKNATGDLSAYGNLAQLFNLPQFTAGSLMSNTPNSKLFG